MLKALSHAFWGGLAPNAFFLILAGFALAIGLTNCKISTPFRAPEIDPSGQAVGAPDDRVVVGVTHVVVGKDGRRAKTFWSNVWKVKGSLEARPGFLGASLRRQLFGNQAWTMTVWEDHQSLDAFVRHAVHRSAMKEGMPALVKARFARIEVARDEIPISWKRAERLLETEGWEYGDDAAAHARP